MSAIRLPLLCAFAGGCLSGAVLLGIWREDASTDAGVPAQPRVARNSELVTAPIAAAKTEAPQEVAKADSHVPSTSAQAEPPGPPPADAEPTPAGSAVSDVLTDLEAAYRQRLIAAARAEAAEAAQASAALDRPPAPAATTVAHADPPREVAQAFTPPVAPPAAPPPVPSAIAPATIAPPVEAAPAPVAQLDARPPDVHIGDVNQNTYNITNVRQGDVYVTQQLAMLQYMQLLGMASNAGVTQPARVRGGAQRSTPQFRQFPSTLINPDNPWGFTFSPPNLVH